MPHVLKALQLLSEEKFVSRAMFGREIHLGEGAVKTLISHLREAEIIESNRSGSYLTNRGQKFTNKILKSIPKECQVGKCNLIPHKNNHAIIIKDYAFAIKSGLEQRDYAILYGSEGCITMLFKEGKFIFPNNDQDCFQKDKKTREYLLEKLCPENNDVIIISSSNDSFIAEISAKNSALWTMATN